MTMLPFEVSRARTLHHEPEAYLPREGLLDVRLILMLQKRLGVNYDLKAVKDLNTDPFEEDGVPELINLVLILLSPVDDLVNLEANQLVDAQLLQVDLTADAAPNQATQDQAEHSYTKLSLQIEFILPLMPNTRAPLPTMKPPPPNILTPTIIPVHFLSVKALSLTCFSICSWNRWLKSTISCANSCFLSVTAAAAASSSLVPLANS